jgi:hypothetical protein
MKEGLSVELTYCMLTYEYTPVKGFLGDWIVIEQAIEIESACCVRNYGQWVLREQAAIGTGSDLRSTFAESLADQAQYS